MSEPSEEIRKAHDDAWNALQEARRNADRPFKQAVGPIIKDRDVQIADVEREYGSKVREAKAELAALTRRTHSQLTDLKTWRDAKIRAIERAAETLKAPHSAERKRAIEPAAKAYDQASKALRDAWGQP